MRSSFRRKYLQSLFRAKLKDERLTERAQDGILSGHFFILAGISLSFVKQTMKNLSNFSHFRHEAPKIVLKY
jgi:hypothetical protein